MTWNDYYMTIRSHKILSGFLLHMPHRAGRIFDLKSTHHNLNQMVAKLQATFVSELFANATNDLNVTEACL